MLPHTHLPSRASTENVISDVWVAWERISQKLIFWRHVEEVRVATRYFWMIKAFHGEIRSFYVGQS